MLRTSPFCFIHFTRGSLLVCGLFALALQGEVASAQAPRATLQLPTFRVHQSRSSFSVPDGGTFNLGGVGNRGAATGGRSFSSGRTEASARVLVMEELERKMLAAQMLGNNRPIIQASGLTQQQLNGSPEIQAKADFITRHIDRLSR